MSSVYGVGMQKGRQVIETSAQLDRDKIQLCCRKSSLFCWDLSLQLRNRGLPCATGQSREVFAGRQEGRWTG